MNLIRSDLGLSNLALSNSGFRQAAVGFRGKRRAFRIHSHCVNAQRALEETLRLFFPVLSAGPLNYVSYSPDMSRPSSAKISDDHLLLYWAQAVSDEALAQQIGGRFDHILVDEYQDTNGSSPRSYWD